MLPYKFNFMFMDTGYPCMVYICLAELLKVLEKNKTKQKQKQQKRYSLPQVCIQNTLHNAYLEWVNIQSNQHSLRLLQFELKMYACDIKSCSVAYKSHPLVFVVITVST